MSKQISDIKDLLRDHLKPFMEELKQIRELVTATSTQITENNEVIRELNIKLDAIEQTVNMVESRNTGRKLVGRGKKTATKKTDKENEEPESIELKKPIKQPEEEKKKPASKTPAKPIIKRAAVKTIDTTRETEEEPESNTPRTPKTPDRKVETKTKNKKEVETKTKTPRNSEEKAPPKKQVEKTPAVKKEKADKKYNIMTVFKEEFGQNEKMFNIINKIIIIIL